MGVVKGTRIPGVKVFIVMPHCLRVRQFRVQKVGDDFRRLRGVARAVGTVSRMVPGIPVLLRMCLLLHVVARMVHHVLIPSPYTRSLTTSITRVQGTHSKVLSKTLRTPGNDHLHTREATVRGAAGQTDRLRDHRHHAAP